MLNLKAACGCEIGKMRTNNEDNFFFYRSILNMNNSGLGKMLTLEKNLCKPLYFGVFDGMGGEAFGEEASYLAAKTLLSHVEKFGALTDLYKVIQEANLKICAASRTHSAGIMGSTAVLLKISHDSASVLNLGDSKAFLFRDDCMEQISIDHTDRAVLEQYGIKKRKPALTQHLGIEPSEMMIDPFSVTIDIQLDDQILICSVGLTDMVSTDRIEEILRNDLQPEKSVHTLINEAIANGGNDNITVIVSKIVS
jgi:protein phosphatase